MYKFEGTNYQKSKDLSVAEIGKLIKQEFKKEFPEIKLSVKSQVYSGGCSIHAQITEYKGRVFTDSYLQYRTEPDYMLSNMLFNDYCIVKRIECQRFTPNLLKVLERLEEIGNSYNFDDSDSQTDYFSNSFYYFADLDSSFEYTKLETEKLDYCKRISEKKWENMEEGKLCK
jgi:hypothetical protein